MVGFVNKNNVYAPVYPSTILFKWPDYYFSLLFGIIFRGSESNEKQNPNNINGLQPLISSPIRYNIYYVEYRKLFEQTENPIKSGVSRFWKILEQFGLLIFA